MRGSPRRGAGGLRAVVARSLLAATLLTAASALVTQNAFAHAAFLAAKPEPGTRLERSPPRIALEFTEPLNRKLTRATLVDVTTGKRIATTQVAASRRELALRPARALPRAPYRVEWHTISTLDGHPLEGSFGFGVRTAAVGGEHQVEQSPLARRGWVRIAARAVFYAALVFFAGGLLTAALLSAPARRSAWLVPPPVRALLASSGTDPDLLAERVWRRTVDVGWLAAAAGAVVAVVEAADAAGGLSLHGLSDFLLSNIAGLGRVAAVGTVAAAALGATRWPRLAAGWSTLALLALALSGHANSAEPRFLAVVSDWVHLVAASIWVGGIAQIATVWWPLLRRAGQPLRRAVMRHVLSPFGRLALPAFLVLATAGLVNALVELGSVQALWQEPYGLVLGAKIELVGLIALASYWHALRIRPRLLAANPHPPDVLERRHWRLLRSEPVLGAAVVTAAAALVAFPLPPRQLQAGEDAEASLAAQPPCNPCPLPKPRADELAVAEQGGSSIVAAWLRRDGASISGRVRLVDSNEKAVAADAKIVGASEQKSCGPGCWTFRFSSAPATIAVRVPQRGRIYTALLPARWREKGNRLARRLLVRAQRVMQSLRSFRVDETVTSGPGSLVRTLYRLQAPDRFAYRTSSGGASVTIGTRDWTRPERGLPWRRDRFGGGGPGFRTRSWFRWTSYAQAVRLLGIRRRGGHRIAELVLFDPGTPVWFYVPIDLATMHVTRYRMVAGGHFMKDRVFAINEPVRIEPPRRNAR